MFLQIGRIPPDEKIWNLGPKRKGRKSTSRENFVPVCSAIMVQGNWRQQHVAEVCPELRNESGVTREPRWSRNVTPFIEPPVFSGPRHASAWPDTTTTTSIASERTTLIGRDPSRYCAVIGWDHGIATPSLFCHPQPLLLRVFLVLPLWVYGIRIGGFHAQKESIIGRPYKSLWHERVTRVGVLHSASLHWDIFSFPGRGDV